MRGFFVPISGGGGWRLAVGSTSRQLGQHRVLPLPVIGGWGKRLAVGNALPATRHPGLPAATWNV
jgi:hypothetical protein